MATISPIQCRTGRVIAELTLEQLAERSGVSKQAIFKFESGKGDPRHSTISALKTALEACGVEFLDSDGVRPKRSNIRTLIGAQIHRALLDEIYHDMKDRGGEILIKGVDESRWESGDDKAFLDHHIDRLTKADVTERLLVSDQFPLTVTHKHWYRRVPHKYFAPHTQWIWAGKLAMVTWGKPETVIIIESKELFDAETRQFNFIWDHGEPLE